jgi:hypothetical protein
LEIIAQYAAQRFGCAFGFTPYKDWQMRSEIIRNQLPIVKLTFLSLSFFFSLVKAPMTDLHPWKWRKDCFNVKTVKTVTNAQ